MATWKKDIVRAISELGGRASLEDIYEKVKRQRETKLPKSWQAIIRGTIETHSSDSDAYTNKENLFYSVEGIGSGIWGLRSSGKN